MAKKSKNQDVNEVESNDIVLDGIPGADQMPEEDANKEFKVDLNFEDEPKSEDDEVEFPKEGEVEEITEEELKDNSEEAEQEPEEEAEAETAEAESEDGEVGEQEEVLADDEGDSQQPEGTDEAGIDEKTPKEPMIPKSRLDQVLQKQKALETQLQEAQNPAPEAIEKAPEYDFDVKEQEYQTLVLEGDQDKATKLRAEIREAEKQQMMFEMQSRMGHTVKRSQEEADLLAKAAEVEAKYPALDQNSATFDEPKAKEVLELRDEAVNLIMPSPVDEKTLDPVEQKVVEKKKVANVNKKIAAAESQPPAMKGKNKTEKKVDINTLSIDEFDALPAETLKRMRGDFG
jgi:hypothetical protein